jgi:lupus La protein
VKELSAAEAAKMKRQIEFYFSDANFPRDKFLLAQTKESKDGFIPLSVLTTFNRVKAITTNVPQIRAAIGDSDVVVFSEDGSKVKRKHPVPENLNTDQRTAHVRGLPTSGSSLEELIAFFGQYGNVGAVRVVKNKKKEATGSAFVEWASEEDMAKFLAVETLTFKDKEIKAQSKEDFTKSMKESLLTKRAEPEPVTEPEFTEGLLVKFKGVDKEADVYPAKLKEFFQSIAGAKYVEFDKGDEEGIVRCETPEEAKKLAESDQKFEETTLTYELVTGSDEKMFYVRSENQKRSRATGGGGKRGGRGGRGRGGGRGGRGGRGGKQHRF